MAVPTASAGFVAGRMTGEWDGNPIGQIKEGYTIEHVPRKQKVSGDLYGPDTWQDGVFLGFDVFIEFVMLEFDPTCCFESLIAWPYGGGTMGNSGASGYADIISSKEKTLILTDSGVGGVPAENNPHTITCPQAILAKGFPASLLLAPRLREVPMRMRLYPNTIGQFFILSAT